MSDQSPEMLSTVSSEPVPVPVSGEVAAAVGCCGGARESPWSNNAPGRAGLRSQVEALVQEGGRKRATGG